MVWNLNNFLPDILANKTHSTNAEHGGSYSWWKGETTNGTVGGAVGGIGSICGSAVWSWVHSDLFYLYTNTKISQPLAPPSWCIVYLLSKKRWLLWPLVKVNHAFMGNLEVWPENMGPMSSSWCRNLEKWNEDAW